MDDAPIHPPNHLDATSSRLLNRLAGEDAGAWRELVEIYGPPVRYWIRKGGLKGADMADVFQEVFLAVHKKAEQWKPSGRSGSFRAWLFETARRACLKSLRGRARMPSASDSAISETPDHRIEATGEAEKEDWQRWAFYAAAAQVEREVQPRTWQAFWQSAVENRDPQIVADELELTVGSVYTAKCRVMAKIREQVNELSTS